MQDSTEKVKEQLQSVGRQALAPVEDAARKAGTMVMPRTMGDRIVLALRHHDWDQRDLARVSGIPNGTLSKYVNDVTRPPLDRLEKIARALGVTPNDLLGFTPHSSNDGTPEYPTWPVEPIAA